MTTRDRQRSARGDVLDVCAAARDPHQLMRELGRIISAVVSCDQWFMYMVEPSTLLPIYREWRSDATPEAWEVAKAEFLGHDFNTFESLSHSTTHACSLQLATGGALRRSLRFKKLLHPLNVTDELRAAFVAESVCWGHTALLRTGHIPFSSAEIAFVANLSHHIGQAFRQVAWLDDLPRATRFIPCVVVLDEHDRIQTLTTGGDGWLEELRVCAPHVERSLPLVLTLAAHHTRASRAPSISGRGSFRRVRTTRGSWVSIRGTRVQAKNRAGEVGVIVEPVSPSDITEFLLTAYRLTPREREIVRLLAVGRSCKQIAHALEMSRHTVREHIDTALGKVGVHAGGELISKLFVEPGLDSLPT